MSDDRAPDPTATDDDLLPDHAATDDQPDHETEPPAADVAAADAAAARADEPVYAANAPADEAVVQDEQVDQGGAPVPVGSVATDEQGVDADDLDPPAGTEQPVAEDMAGGDTPLDAQDAADRGRSVGDGDDWADNDARPAGEADGIEELSADVRALDDRDPESAGAFDDSSSVVESDQTDTGVVDDAGDGGDGHARDQAVRDLDDDHDGLEAPER